MIEQESFLLQNQMNPFPVAGQLVLTDEGQMSFTLSEKAAGANLGWLEKHTGQDGLKEKIQSGERPVVFDVSVSGQKVAWPKTLGGYAMKFEADGRKWIVSLNYPSGGALWQTINMVKSGGVTKPWKEALAGAGAK